MPPYLHGPLSRRRPAVGLELGLWLGAGLPAGVSGGTTGGGPHDDGGFRRGGKAFTVASQTVELAFRVIEPRIESAGERFVRLHAAAQTAGGGQYLVEPADALVSYGDDEGSSSGMFPYVWHDSLPG